MQQLIETPAWKELQAHSEHFRQSDFQLRSLFNSPDHRFDSFSLRHEDLLLDFSKNYLDKETIPLLIDLAIQRKVPAAIQAMFAGDKINSTEHRAALHVALREPSSSNKHPEIEDCLSQMEEFVGSVHRGDWTGYSGKKITDVVNIGIGGSDLGPAMVTAALASYATDELTLHYVSNVDPFHLASTLDSLAPETTLFIVASKSFTTLETHQNAESARRWLLAKAPDETAVAKHFVASTSNPEAAIAFGIQRSNLFPLWDWVGGRYSLWSAIGLPVALAVGMANFRQLLAGAHSMDQHFRHTELAENMPVIMALLTVMYSGLYDATSTAVVPYSQRLHQFPSYLQQLSMESLGKSVDLQDKPVSTNTGEIIWGSAGSNGQHSYFQLLHQGTGFVPVDFIAIAASGNKQLTHLLANCLSQSLALMEGRLEENTPHKSVAGNKPSNTLLLSALNPFNLGSLIALYEHKVYVQSVIWNINAFDQWGVELGKKLSAEIFDALDKDSHDKKLDDSTANLIKQIRDWNR